MFTGDDAAYNGGMSTSRGSALLVDGFGRVAQNIPDVVDGLGPEDLAWQPQPGANPVGWLVWHIGRMEDVQIADLSGTEQVWTSDGWAERFGLPYPVEAHGYGQTADEVAAFAIDDPSLLTGYYAAVHRATLDFLRTATDNDHDRVIDDNWEPPVTMAVRLVSIVDDAAQHVGQAAYVKGLLKYRSS